MRGSFSDGGRSPELEEAVRAGASEAVARLLEGADLPPLAGPLVWLAADAGHNAVVSILALKKADLEARGPTGQTPLIAAAARGYLPVMESLLAAKANPAAEASTGCTPLLELCGSLPGKPARKEGGPAERKFFGHSEAGMGAGASGREQHTAVSVAVTSGQLDAVRALVAAKASVDGESHSGVTALIAAGRAGVPETIKLLVELKADPNRPNCIGLTPLATAVLAGAEAGTRALVSAGANPNSILQHPWGSALCVAATRAALTVIHRLVASRAEVDLVTPQGETALTAAAAHGQLGAIKTLCELGASVDLETPKGVTAVLAAVLHGQSAAVETLLASGANPDKLTASGSFPLLVAASTGGLQACQTLVAGRANIDQVSLPRGLSALSAAISNGRDQAVELLLRLNASPQKQAGGLTPAAIAAKHGQLASLDRLASADRQSLHTGCDNGSTPLLQAVEAAQVPAIQALIRHKVDPNSETPHGTTPLIAATVKGNTQVVNALILQRADPQYETQSGRTALAAAAACSLPGMLTVLLNAGADINRVSGVRGCTALQLAVNNRKLQSVETLIAHSAIVNVVKGSNQSPPLHVAAMLGDKGLVKKLLDAKADPEEDHAGCSALVAAAQCSDCPTNSRVLALLLERSARGHDRHGSFSDAGVAMLEAVRHDNAGALKLLMRSDTSSESKVAALSEAIAKARLSVIPLLIPHVGREQAALALMEAVTSNDNRAAKMLLDLRPDLPINHESSEGDTALMVAAAHGNVAALSMLLAHRADANLETSLGNTALIAAAFDGRSHAVRVLLQAGARAGHVTTIGLSALSAAALGEIETHKECIELLWPVQTSIPVTNSALPPLHAACEAGKLSMVKYLMRLSADVTASVGGLSPLMRSCKAPQNAAKIARVLLEAGAPATLANEQGETAMHMAALVCDNDLIRILVRHRANPTAAADDGRSPVAWAASHGNVETVALLVAAGAEQDPGALCAACESRDMECLGALIQAGFDPYASSPGQLSAIEYACSHGDAQLVAFFAAQQRVLSLVEQHQLLTFAVQSGSPETVVTLLETGCSANAAAGRTPKAMELACMLGHLDIVDLLLASNAPVSTLSLIAAAASTDESGDLLQLLLSKIPDINSINSQVLAGSLCAGQTPLIAASTVGSTVAVKALIAARATVDFETAVSGQTALIAASSFGRVETIELLVNSGARVNYETRAGATALLHAVFHSQNDTIGALVELNADPNHVHRTGATALMEAAANGDVLAVAALLASGGSPALEAASEEFQLADMLPIEAAARMGHAAVVHALVSGGASVLQTQRPALSEVAAANGHAETSKVLQEYERR